MKREKNPPCQMGVVSLPMEKGGLGLGNLKEKNWSLHAKMWWRFGEEKETLLREVIKIKYGESRDGWAPKVATQKEGSQLWKDISTLGRGRAPNCGRIISTLRRERNRVGAVLKENSGLVLGDGALIKFWVDKWLRSEPLIFSFPILYSISTQKHKVIKELVEVVGGRKAWALTLEGI